MPSTSQIAELTRIVDDVVTVAQADISALYRTIAGTNPPVATQVLSAELPDIVTAWGDVATTVSADWYATVRPDAGAYTPQYAEPLPVEQTQAMVRWATTPLWQSFDWDAAERDLLDGSGRLVRLPSRETVEATSLADPASGGWVRVARLDACPFCLMLASRGAVYTSAETASRSVRSGRSYHDNCHCTVSPVFDPETDVPDFNKALQREWRDVTAGHRDQFAAWSEHISLTRT